ncbi:MAG: 1-acyl-sn-glycerol-3-phosphate acyltransferase [Candidatus Riflebacteria bacterium]|nr:1-acyl-sn-glycerol-3-phosphate acyltransferase [Candidatus Riflebacteria bacterium]
MKKYFKYIYMIPLAVISYFIWKLAKFWLKPTGGNEGWIAEAQPSEVWRLITVGFWRIFFTLYNRMELIDSHLIPNAKDGNFVSVANHESILDGFVLACTVWRQQYIMVKKEAFDIPLKGYYLRKVFCFPVNRGKTDTLAIKKALKCLSDGYNLGLFPEGTRNRAGFVSEFKSGAIKLALKKKIPILPMYIGNSHNITPPNTIFPRPAKLTVKFLEMIDTEAELKAGKTEKEIADMLYKRITDAGKEIMGYDVRDPEYLKKLRNEN